MFNKMNTIKVTSFKENRTSWSSSKLSCNSCVPLVTGCPSNVTMKQLLQLSGNVLQFTPSYKASYMDVLASWWSFKNFSFEKLLVEKWLSNTCNGAMLSKNQLSEWRVWTRFANRQKTIIWWSGQDICWFRSLHSLYIWSIITFFASDLKSE